MDKSSSERSRSGRRLGAWLRLAKWVAAVAMLAWVTCSLMVFPAALLIDTYGSPGWLELPWSELSDFVIGKDGDVFAAVGLYRRILRYDEHGHFKTSYSIPSFSNHPVRMAVAKDGTVYVNVDEEIYAYDMNWRPKLSVIVDLGSNRLCTLAENGKVHVVATGGAEIPREDGFVSPGQVLFSSATRARSRFTRPDGSVVFRRGNRLVMVSASGTEIRRYGTNVLLEWAGFPFPSTLGLIGLPLLFDRRLKRRKWAGGTRDPKRAHPLP
ncbi:MAG TPA: hypothetical protein VJX67_17345 [Blastocatellia bacterium]|nr:hypothetical protein [Blastocatellia bacterium]